MLIASSLIFFFYLFIERAIILLIRREICNKVVPYKIRCHYRPDSSINNTFWTNEVQPNFLTNITILGLQPNFMFDEHYYIQFSPNEVQPKWSSNKPDGLSGCHSLCKKSWPIDVMGQLPYRTGLKYNIQNDH